MYLYHISQTENNDYDTYSNAVVCAPDQDTARNMDPCSGELMNEKSWTMKYSSWCSKPENVTVKFLGSAEPTVKQGVICASFHAG